MSNSHVYIKPEDSANTLAKPGARTFEHEPQVKTETELVVEVLERAKAKLSTVGWTRYAFARNSMGMWVDSGSALATCYCALGAIDAVAMERGSLLMNVRLPAIIVLANVISGIEGDPYRQRNYPYIVSQFNDEQSNKEPVLAMFDKAIESLKQN